MPVARNKKAHNPTGVMRSFIAAWAFGRLPNEREPQAPVLRRIRLMQMDVFLKLDPRIGRQAG